MSNILYSSNQPFWVKIAENDQLPKAICAVCLDELLAAIKFRQKCELSEQNLHKLVNEQIEAASSEPVEDKAALDEFLDNVDETHQSTYQEVDDTQCYNVIEMMSFRCCICSAILHSQEERQQHIESVHNILFLEDTRCFGAHQTCFICQQTFESSEELETHQGKSFIELFQCNSCDDVYETNDTVAEHFYQTHVADSSTNKTPDDPIDEPSRKTPVKKGKTARNITERYCCVTHCHEAFPDEEQLITHAHEQHELKLKHNQERNDPNKPFLCNVCFRTFGSNKNLKVHQFVRANHAQGKHFLCTHCSFRAVSRSILTIHERSKHSGERPYECSFCDKRFFSELHLKNHLVCHSTERPFTCAFCEKGFSRKRNMEEHIRSCHSEEKPYKCDICPARFKVPQHLRIHARIHSGEKPYKCSYCDNSYYHISDRKRHEMVHTGEKPYKCDSCGAAFTRKRTLKIHERTHSGERPFCCEVCGKGFCQNATLKKHIERHMRVEEDIILAAEMLHEAAGMDVDEDHGIE